MEQLLSLFTPKNYHLSLEIDKYKKTRKGIVKISGYSKSETIKFHCVGTEVDSVTIDGKKVDFSVEDGILSVSTPASSDLTLEVAFHGSLNENMQGAYLSTYQNGKQKEIIVSTQFESHYARECFPCIDEPAAKATFDLELSSTDPEDQIIANTPVENVVKNTTIFETTPVMSTYLLAFVIGKFKSKTIKNTHGVEITTYIPLNQREETIDFANDIAARSLDYYDDLFGIPYPLPKLDQVAIPDFEAGAMENWGLVTYRESCLLVDGTSSVESKKSVATTIAHELSHQWFGDLVTMKWWDDLWLNESFASVIEYYAVDFLHPEYNIWEYFFTGDCLSALKRDSLPGVQAVQQPVENPAEIATLFDGAIVYAKGAHLMLMLIRLMGEAKFFSGIKAYFKAFKYRNARGDDLWNALQPFADFNIKNFMHAWISQPGYPVLTDGTQQRFLIGDHSDETRWPLPEITDDMSGHYLINLSGPEFAETLANFADLSLEQRLRLLIDRMLLARTPLVSAASLLEILAKFKTETSPAIWDILLSIISDLKIFFTPDSPEESQFKNFIIDLIDPNLSRLGAIPIAGESESDMRLRSCLLSLAHYARYTSVLSELSAQYCSDYYKIHPEIRANVLLAKLQLEEAEFFPVYLKNYQSVSDPELKFSLLCALTSARLEENVDQLIELLGKPEIVKPQDHLYLYIYLRRNPRAKVAALDWLFANWDYVAKMSGEKSIEDYPRYTAATVLTREEKDKFFTFFEKLKDQPVLKRTLEIAKAEIESRLTLIKLNQSAINSHLKNV